MLRDKQYAGWFTGLIVAVFCLTSGPFTYAQESRDESLDVLGLNSEALQVTPQLSVDETYNSNIFRSDTDETDDFITTVSPGAQLEYHRDSFKLDTSYRANLLYYGQEEQHNDAEHNARLRGQFDLGSITFSAGSQFSRNSNPIGDVVPGEELVVTDQLLYFGQAAYERGPVYSSLKYTHSDRSYRTDTFDFLDRSSHDGLAKFQYQLSRRVNAVSSARLGSSDYDEEAKQDRTYYEVAGGLEWVLHPTFAIKPEVGYRSEDYDTDPGSSLTTDVSDPVYRLGIQWKPDNRNHLKASVMRHYVNSVTSNFIEEDEFSIKYIRTIGDRSRLSLDVTYTNGEESNDTVAQPEKDTVYSDLRVEHDPVSWITLEGGYRYADKSTSDDTGEYTEHIVQVSSTFRF